MWSLTASWATTQENVDALRAAVHHPADGAHAFLRGLGGHGGLPARSGQGEPLTQAALDALIREHQPAVFFSKDLFARYFTYIKNGESHFILFDDADTLRQKLRLGRQLGVAAAFFQWPEVCDIADSLFRRK